MTTRIQITDHTYLYGKQIKVVERDLPVRGYNRAYNAWIDELEAEAGRDIESLKISRRDILVLG